MEKEIHKTCESVWANCLRTIRSEVPEQSFLTWFSPIRPLKFDSNVITIEVPSPFFYEWLEEYYVHVLKKAITLELGPHGKLEYSMVVDKGNGKEAPARTLNVRKHNHQPQARPQPQQPSNQGNQWQQKPAPARQLQPIADPFALPSFDKRSTDSHLKSNYTFDTFIEGDCNRLARSAGEAIARKPGMTSFNPLVVYGGVGLGKTHLVQAIGSEIKANWPDNFVLYVTSDQFTTQFIDALKNNSIQHFTNYYLQVDTLIIDDIQFLANKEKTQENFFHIFNRLHQSGKQIIMTSDRPPRSLKGLQERLLSRFKWGLTADVQIPDFETRVAIVQTKIQSEGIFVPDDVLEYIAYNVDSNIRELEGVLISLIAHASFRKKDIDLDLAKATLIDIVRNTEKEITIEFISQIVCDYFNISLEELKSKTRKKDIATARQIAMYFSKEYTEMPLKRIGQHFGGRDHSTVVHASKTVSAKSTSDALYRKIIDELLDQLGVKK